MASESQPQSSSARRDTPSHQLQTAAAQSRARVRLAIVAGHPVQYVAPWFAELARRDDLEIHVFYLWDFGVVKTKDPGFGIAVEWDIPLLDGYAYTFTRNHSKDPGNHHFLGYINPSLPRRVSEWKPDAVLVMNYAFLTYFQFLADPRLWFVPLLFRGDSHDVGRRPGTRTLLARTLRRLLFLRFSAFLVVGSHHRQYLRSSGVPDHKLFAAPHAIDNARFQDAAPQAAEEARVLRCKLSIDPQQILIVFVGKLIAIKRPFDLLNAFTSLPATLRHNASLLFVGEGDLKSGLQQQSENEGLENVHYLPFMNQSQLPAVYAAADLIILPSRSETWGLVINEAMNLACPAVVTDRVGCAPDLVISDYSGWTYPMGDVQALASILANAISDPQRLAAMGDNSRALIDSHSFSSLTRGLLAAIEAVRR